MRPADHDPVEEGITVVVLAGGDPPPAWVAGELPSQVHVIAADSGLNHARRLGLTVATIVGDLDSVAADELAHHSQARVQVHSPDKDQTDLDLALEAALALDPSRIIVVGGGGGRIDHLLANASLMAADRFAGTDVLWLVAQSAVHVVRATLEVHGSRGDLVSLLPFGGQATGVSTRGLHWPLDHATLSPGTTRGVSNRMTGPLARVHLQTGVILVVHTANDLHG